MGRLIGLVKPMLPVMALAVCMGIVGYLCAIFLTILGTEGLLILGGRYGTLTFGTVVGLLAAASVLRGILRYAEQASNHYIAFKLLALIRHKVFVKLRTLAPAKLEGRGKGNLISVITSDIELLEVFYAHTISPIVIACGTSLIMTWFIGRIHPLLGVLALAAYVTVGAVLPLVSSKLGGDIGLIYRNAYGKMNSFFLDSLRGLKESIGFGRGEERMEQINGRTEETEKYQETLKKYEGVNRAVTDSVVLVFSMGMLAAGIGLYLNGRIELSGMLLAFVAMMSSFGPVVALSSLSNQLFQTIASGNRVLDLLEEEPVAEEITDGAAGRYDGAQLAHVSFSYGREKILDQVDLTIPKNTILGIHGKSGSGKSTILKLLMRFWETDRGEIRIGGENINRINTASLRGMESYVTQETYLFHDTLAENIGIAKEGASREEIMEAAKKASIHDFIMSLPNGYDTNAGELGSHLSGGEKQRIGVARAFLHDAPFILLDEPTSNLDSLNEAALLKALKEERKGKTIILVSHRRSTMNIADEMVEMESERVS
ncbi:MAG: ABC transporter ATP-binding protein [Lachnospiraceae bacterium]|nr:ABC transporter ATP-binding protein [Lachnospiraceae bacterium]